MSALSLSLMSIRFKLHDRQESALQIVKCGSQESKGAFFSCNHDRLAKDIFGTLVFYNGDVGAHVHGLCAGRRWAMCWVLFFSVTQMDLCSPKPALPPSPLSLLIRGGDSRKGLCLQHTQVKVKRVLEVERSMWVCGSRSGQSE